MIHHTGPLWKCVGASMAVSGIAPPVILDGNLLVDGGVLNNLPSDIVKEWCEGFVIAVDVTGKGDFSTSSSRQAPPPHHLFVLAVGKNG